VSLTRPFVIDLVENQGGLTIPRFQVCGVLFSLQVFVLVVIFVLLESKGESMRVKRKGIRFDVKEG